MNPTVANMPLAARPSLDLVAPSNRVNLAVKDILDGLMHWQLWLTMAWYEIRLRYRRSVLGPLWLTVSMGVTVGFLGVLYGTLLKMDIHRFMPYLALGLLIWGYIAGIIGEGCNAFIQSENFIKQVRLPLSTFAYRVVCRNVITMGHNALVYVVVAIMFQVNPGYFVLLAIPGLILLIVNSIWMVLLVGVFCTRFRDVPNIVQSLLQVVFFITPILWTRALLANREYLVDWNPVHHFLELVRAPLMGEAPDMLSWQVALGTTVLGSTLTFLLFVKYRNRIAFWL